MQYFRAMGHSSFFFTKSLYSTRVQAKYTRVDKEELVLMILVNIQRHFNDMVA